MSRIMAEYEIIGTQASQNSGDRSAPAQKLSTCAENCYLESYVQQPGQEHTQVYQSQTQQNLQQGTSHNQQYQGQQQYIQVQQSQPPVIHIPRQMPPRQQVPQNHYQYQVQDHSNQQNHPTSQSGQQPQHSHIQQQQPQQQFVVMQVQHPQQQQQQVVSYQYQQPQNVQHQQGIQQSQQPRYVIQQQQSGVQANTPTAPQRFFIKSPHQGPQRHLTPTMQTVNRSQQQYSAPTSNQTQQLNPVRQQWQTQQQPIRGQVMNQQIPLQQGMPQKRTIMIQSNAPVQGNVIRLQPNSNFQAGQQRMMQIHPSNNGAVMQPSSQPINNSSQQQYSNLRMTNGAQGSSQVVRPNIPPRVPHHVNLRPMTANNSQGQYPTQTTGNMPQQSTMIQQQGISNLRQQSPINQWENRPRISLQTSHHPQNPRSSVPQQQPFTMQMRPTGQTIVQASQVQESSQQNDIAYDVGHVFNENGREVRKMPIKMGDDTIWVDVKNDGASGNSEDSIMFKLDMEGNGNSNPTVSEARAVEDSATNSPSDDALHQTHPVIHTDWKSNKSKLTDELRNQIVKECCEDLISPAELASRHGVNVVQIRKIVKDAGKKLPTKYKVTSSRNISTTVQCSTTLGPTNHVTQTPAVSGHQNQMSIHGPQLVSSSNTGVFRQVIVTDSSGNKVHGIAGTNQSLGLTLPQKPTPPGITLVKPGFNSPSAAGKTSSGANTVLDKKPSLPTEEQSYKGKIIPGKLAVCRNCGGYSSDFNRCSRCKKPIPENCKTVDDDTKFGKTVKGEFSKLNAERLREANKDVLRNIRIQHKGRKKQNQDEPECIALSSDEDGDDEDEESESRTGDEEFDADECNTNDIKDTEKDLRIEKVASELSEIISVSDNQGKTYASLQCRSVRIGSYKSMPKEKAFVTEEAFQIKVPSIGNQNELVTLTILKSEISHIYAHFGRTMPLLFIFCHGHACARIRSSLKMTSKNTGLWFDVDCNDEKMRDIGISLEKTTVDLKNILDTFYDNVIKEIDEKTGNDMLVRSSPKDLIQKLPNIKTEECHSSGSIIRTNRAVGLPTVNYCRYPPTGNSSVSVSSVDYSCLEGETFINDTIIDFYFKWMQINIMKEVDYNRTHIFSTYFYKRLTTRPAKQKNKVHPVEDDPNLTPADKRYERVKRWTKKTNIFEKDFIVVPINEHSHWFVAVICFPGIEGCRNSDTNQSVDEPESQKKASAAQQLRKKKRPKDGTKRVMQIGSTSIIPLKGAGASGLLEKFGLDDDQSDRDEAEASDDDIFNPEDDEFLFDSPASKEDSSQGKTENDAHDSSVTKPKEELAERNDTVKDESKCDENDSSKNEKSNENVDESITSGTRLSDSAEKEPCKDAPEKEKNTVDNSSSDLKNIIKEEAPIRQPCILIFDSLHSGSRAKVAATLREYLACEYKAKMTHLGRERIFNKETFRGCCPKVPQQPNFSDCGLYLLQYIEAFFETPIRSFALPITSLNNWFPKETVKHKREKIAEIIRNLAVTQNPDKKFNFPALEFVGVGAGYSDDEDDDDDMEPDEKDTNLVHPSISNSSIVITTSARPGAQLPTSASNTSIIMNDEKERTQKLSETSKIDTSKMIVDKTVEQIHQKIEVFNQNLLVLEDKSIVIQNKPPQESKESSLIPVTSSLISFSAVETSTPVSSYENTSLCKQNSHYHNQSIDSSKLQQSCQISDFKAKGDLGLTRTQTFTENVPMSNKLPNSAKITTNQGYSGNENRERIDRNPVTYFQAQPVSAPRLKRNLFSTNKWHDQQKTCEHNSTIDNKDFHAISTDEGLLLSKKPKLK